MKSKAKNILERIISESANAIPDSVIDDLMNYCSASRMGKKELKAKIKSSTASQIATGVQSVAFEGDLPCGDFAAVSIAFGALDDIIAYLKGVNFDYNQRGLEDLKDGDEIDLSQVSSAKKVGETIYLYGTY